MRKQLSAALYGFVYGLLALGAHFTPSMLLFLGLASASNAAALQKILLESFRLHFVLLGALLALITILVYLRRQGVRRLTLADITPYRAFVGTLVLSFLFTYLVLLYLALFVSRG